MLHATAHRGQYESTDDLKKPGLAKLYKDTLRPLAEELFAQGEYRAWIALRTLLASAGRAIRKVKISKVVNHEFKGVSIVAELKEKLKPFTSDRGGGVDGALEELDFFKETRKEVVKKDTTKAIRKRVSDLDEVPIDAEKYPLTYGALTDGSIPLPCIFPSGETYFLTNDNWALWEEMLTKFPEETKELAKNAAARAASTSAT